MNLVLTSFLACIDYIEALEKCHQQEYIKRCFGICNNQKEMLSKCLHEARLETQKHLILKTREKQKVFKEKWQKNAEEEYGEDQFLKKLLEREQAKKGKTN